MQGIVVCFLAGVEILVLSVAFGPALEPAQPIIQLVARVKVTGPTSSAEVMDSWSYTSSHAYIFSVWYLNAVTILP